MKVDISDFLKLKVELEKVNQQISSQKSENEKLIQE